MTKSDIQRFASWLGRRSYKARVERFGLKRIQEIARENGKKGGRPRKDGKRKGGR
jgi:hypothetical protein